MGSTGLAIMCHLFSNCFSYTGKLEVGVSYYKKVHKVSKQLLTGFKRILWENIRLLLTESWIFHSDECHILSEKV